VTFEVDDVESEWQFSRPFDFIHGRYLAGAIADWPNLMRQCYELSFVFLRRVSRTVIRTFGLASMKMDSVNFSCTGTQLLVVG
jgi:hypothetical protein